MTYEYKFKQIYYEYYEKIIRYLVRIVGPNDAEDVAQEVFDRISRNLKGFQGKSKVSTWVYRIATNTAIDRLRSAAYKHGTAHTAIEEADGSETHSVWATEKPRAADQTLIRKEMSECVNEFIDKLPPDYRTVIVLSELEGSANKEISDILEISLDSVKIRLHRARNKLRESLNDGCDFYHNDQNVLACDRKPSQILTKTPK